MSARNAAVPPSAADSDLTDTEAKHEASPDSLHTRTNTADRPLAPGLYIVATPIGNLEDITLRALRVLRSVDRIACEDTRQTQKLLNHYGIQKPTVSYHLHNEAGRANELLDQLRTGARLALVSDAGTPGVADPGTLLVRAAIAAGVQVFPLPGANAALSALVASGLEAEHYTFHGFLPSKAGQRRSALEKLRAQLHSQLHSQLHAQRHTQLPTADEENTTTHIFYETPHRILDCLTDVVAVFGPAQRLALARELTKLHEEFLRGTVAEVLATLQSRPAVRGEMVLILEGALAEHAAGTASTRSLAEAVETLMRDGASEKDALKQAAKARGLSKSEAYREWQRTKHAAH